MPQKTSACDILNIILPYIGSELLGLLGPFLIGIGVNVLSVVLKNISSDCAMVVQEEKKRTSVMDSIFGTLTSMT